MSNVATAKTSPTVLEAVGREHRINAGKAMRERVKRSSHSELPRRPRSFDLLALIEGANVDRVPSLIPIRHHRMATSAFAFYRGSAGLMAADLADTPTTGINVQLCGDAHCGNFGAFATPERNVIFDVRDFDETLPGPWEWDVKRLAASLVLASSEIDGSATEGETAARFAVRAYRQTMLDLAQLSTLDTWYSRVDVRDILATAGSTALRKKRRTYVDGIERRTVQKALTI